MADTRLLERLTASDLFLLLWAISPDASGGLPAEDRPAAEITGEIVGPVCMARSDPGRAGARGWVRDAGPDLSRARRVPCEVHTRMTCVTQREPPEAGGHTSPGRT